MVRVDYSGQIWIYAALGGGIAGGLIGALSYTASSIMNEEKITVGGFVGATLIGIANGAIGGGAGTITTIGIKLMLSFTTGLISGIYTKYTASGTDEQQREAAMSAMITTSVGTFLGTTFDTNGLSKTATVVANYFTTISASTPTEIINVVTQKHLRNRPKLINSRKTAMLSKKYNLPERARPNGYVSCLNL